MTKYKSICLCDSLIRLKYIDKLNDIVYNYINHYYKENYYEDICYKMS